jgi:hypothetical protein
VSTETRRRCAKCGVLKPLSYFHSVKGLRDGHAPFCSTCAKKAAWADTEKLRVRVL